MGVICYMAIEINTVAIIIDATQYKNFMSSNYFHFRDRRNSGFPR